VVVWRDSGVSSSIQAHFVGWRRRRERRILMVDFLCTVVGVGRCEEHVM
jgi:hypothetical protein